MSLTQGLLNKVNKITIKNSNTEPRAAVGLRDLSECRIGRVVDDHRLRVSYLGKSWMVEQVFFDGHVAAVVHTDRHVRWTLVSENGRESRI